MGFESLKDLWKKLGIKGQVKNFSSFELWVIENDSGKPCAHRLPVGFRSPIDTDSDAFKRTDGKPVEGHSNWWKFYDLSTVEVFDVKGGLRVSAVTKTAVGEEHFGRPAYLDGAWGSSIQLVTDVRRDRQKRITEYHVTGLGWISPERALELTCRHEIDNARPVFPTSGRPFIRTRRDPELFNNLSSKGLA